MKAWRIESKGGAITADSRDEALDAARRVAFPAMVKAEQEMTARAETLAAQTKAAAKKAQEYALVARKKATEAARAFAAKPGSETLRIAYEATDSAYRTALTDEAKAIALAVANRHVKQPPIEHTVVLIDPEGNRFQVALPPRGKGRLAITSLSAIPVPFTSFAVYVRTREYIREGEEDVSERRVEAGPWIFLTRWPTRDEAVEAAIAAENEGLKPSLEGGFELPHGGGKSERKRSEGRFEAKIEEKEGGAMLKEQGRTVHQWRRAPGEVTFSVEGSIRAFRREGGDATFGGRSVPNPETRRRR